MYSPHENCSHGNIIEAKWVLLLKIVETMCWNEAFCFCFYFNENYRFQFSKKKSGWLSSFISHGNHLKSTILSNVTLALNWITITTHQNRHESNLNKSKQTRTQQKYQQKSSIKLYIDTHFTWINAYDWRYWCWWWWWWLLMVVVAVGAVVAADCKCWCVFWSYRAWLPPWKFDQIQAQPI